MVKDKNKEIQRVKDELARKSREIHLPYTYKKRYNEIVKNNLTGSNYPRARTSANQEVTIGNVLDYLDRVINEKNSLKDEMKMLKFKNKRKGYNNKDSSFMNLNNPKSTKNNIRHFSEATDSDYSAPESCRKTFDHGHASDAKLRDRTSLMMQGSTKLNSTTSYK